MSRLRHLAVPLLAVALSTVLLALWARVEVEFLVLGPIALLPMLFVLDRAPTLGAALRPALLLTITFTLTVFAWFPGSLAAYSGASTLVCVLVVLLLAPLFQPQFVVWALVRHLVRRSALPDATARWRAALAASLAYVAVDGLWPKLFGDTLGQAAYASATLRQVADLGGTPGLTLILLLVDEGLYFAVCALADRRAAHALRRVARPLVLVALLLGASYGYGRIRLAQLAAHPPRSEVSVGIVQADLTHYDQAAAQLGPYAVTRHILDTHFALSDTLLEEQHPDLLIWPETVYPTTFGKPKSDDGAAFDREVADFAVTRKIPLIFGAYDRDDRGEYNAAVLLSPQRTEHPAYTVYRKTMLFPLTEWLPVWLDRPWLRSRLPWAGSWQRGPGPRAMPFIDRTGRPLTVAPLICYEVLFPGYIADATRRGAELIVTLSNDSWFSHTPAPKLHLVLAAFRSIETRLAQVRATNSGISAIIAPTGELLATAQDDERAVLDERVPVGKPLPTLAVAWGSWLAPLALLLTVLLLGDALRRKRPSTA